MAIKNSLFIIIVVQFFNCAGTNYKKLSIENPAKLVAVQDSLLLISGDNQRIRDALVIANNSVAGGQGGQDAIAAVMKATSRFPLDDNMTKVLSNYKIV